MHARFFVLVFARLFLQILRSKKKGGFNGLSYTFITATLFHFDPLPLPTLSVVYTPFYQSLCGCVQSAVSLSNNKILKYYARILFSG